MHEDIYYLPATDILPVCYCGISYCDGKYRITRRNSDIFVFEHVVEGEGFYATAGQTFQPAEGDVYIVHRGSDHTYWSDAENPWTKIWFNVSGLILENLVACYGLTGTHLVKNAGLGPLFKRAFQVARTGKSAAAKKIPLMLHEIIASLSGVIKSRQSSPASEMAHALKDYIDSRIADPITMETLSGVVSRSPAQVIRIFRKAFGTTPYSYLLDRRIEMARMLLTSTATPVKHMAFSLGFRDQYYFSNIFKVKTGLSPMAYKKAKGARPD